MSIVVLLVLVLILQLKDSEGRVVLSGPERTLSCPGSSVQFSCNTSPAVNSITWSLQCPNSIPTTYSVGRQQDNYVNTQNCSDTGPSFLTFITFHSTGSMAAQSNLSVSVLATSHSLNSLRSVRVDCEGSGDFKYLDVRGPPSPPLNLQHSFGSNCPSNNTHVPITISWSTPQPSEGSYPVEGYGLTVTHLSDPTHTETSVLVDSLTHSVTVSLPHSQTYMLNLFAVGCGGEVGSRNVSINVLPRLNNSSCAIATPSVSATAASLSVTSGINGSVADSDGRLFTVVVSAVTVGLFLSMCVTFSLILYLIHTCRQWVDVTMKAKDPSIKKRKVSPPTTVPPLIHTMGLSPPPLAERRPAKQVVMEDFQLDRNIAYETVTIPKGHWL